MKRAQNTIRMNHPDKGGQLNPALDQTNSGWPTLGTQQAQGWWVRRIEPFHANYSNVWMRYLLKGYVAPISSAVLAEANLYWTQPDEEGTVQAPLDESAPWTLKDTGGVTIPFGGVDKGTPGVDPASVRISYACGYILHHYYQLDLGKMQRKIASKLQET